MRLLTISTILGVALALNWLELRAQVQVFDIVLVEGRVIDPETKTDKTLNVGITADRIAAVSTEKLTGKLEINCKGLVVAPGFIDLHSHGQNEENYVLQVMDGVTTALELEIGVYPVNSWYNARTNQARTNFGATVGHLGARMQVMGDSGTFIPHDKALQSATPEQQRNILDLLRTGLSDGALGIGFGIAYAPKISHEEVLDAFQVASENGVPAFVHARYLGGLEPGSGLEGLQELLANVAVSRASLHFAHVTSIMIDGTARALEIMRAARDHGLDVTTEMYPYTAAMTEIESPIFEPGWQNRMGISYGDLQWVATGERLTEATFAKYRRDGGLVIIHFIPETALLAALKDPNVLIASDGLMENGKGHPRGAGTYSRVLGHYVRDTRDLSLDDALGKMTILPAKRLEKHVPMMRRKGRVQVGADADLAIFDPRQIIDRATFERPAMPSEGMRYVIVNGTFVVRDGAVVQSAYPGRAVRR